MIKTRLLNRAEEILKEIVGPVSPQTTEDLFTMLKNVRRDIGTFLEDMREFRQEQIKKIEPQIFYILGKGQKITAIKLYRSEIGCGLKSAKDAVEVLMAKADRGFID